MGIVEIDNSGNTVFPTLTPFQAMAKHNELDVASFEYEGFRYQREWVADKQAVEDFSVATNIATDEPFYPDGDYGDDITEENKWLGEEGQILAE